ADVLFQERAPLLAGPAPRRPEIDDDRLLERGVDDLGHKAGRGHIFYRRRPSARRAAKPAADQGLVRHATCSPGNVPSKMAAMARQDKRRCAAVHSAEPPRSRIIGVWPQAAIKRNKSAGAIAVVRSFSSGW